MNRAPLLGEHTLEILSNIGYSNSDLVQLRRAKVI